MVFRKEVNIGGKLIGNGHPCFIVAEAGVSHFGSLDKALELVEAAARAGADAVKFQVFQTAELISSVAPEWVERMRPKELPIEAFREIMDYCRQKGIIFFATAHDPESLEKLAELDPPAYKIGSGELQNFDYFRGVASLKKPVIFSTGMFSEKDILDTIRVFAEAGCSEVILLHCVTGYPVPVEWMNLKAIQTLKSIFPGPVGYSDHSVTYDIAASSVLLGANLVERHITLEKDIPDAQDWKVACNPEELVQFVAMTRRLEAARGDGVLRVSEVELKSMSWARKSIVAAQDILPGDLITAENIRFKRPGTGISPAEIDKVVGKKAKMKIKADSLIEWEQLK
jgi:N-acetylneuraminate synthase/N,N'-diacetyllegionaminate synthase